jgi:hypothetical protein
LWSLSSWIFYFHGGCSDTTKIGVLFQDASGSRWFGPQARNRVLTWISRWLGSLWGFDQNRMLAFDQPDGKSGRIKQINDNVSVGILLNGSHGLRTSMDHSFGCLFRIIGGEGNVTFLMAHFRECHIDFRLPKEFE